MPIRPGDLITSISKSSIETAQGNSSNLKVTFVNTSDSPGYNLYSKVVLPDGVSFDSSEIPYSKISIDESNNQIIEFINITDLYPNESYSFDISVTPDTNYRSNGQVIPFDTSISNVQFEGTVDSTPRGDFNDDNVKATSSVTTTAKGYRFYLKIVFPPKSLKGAGESLSDDPGNPFDIKVNLLNNTRESSSLDDLEINLANGIRYIGTNYSVSGPDAPTFPPPEITEVGPEGNSNKIKISDFDLSPGSENIISFEGAIWDKYATNGVVNSGDIISSSSSLVSSARLSDATSFSYAESSMLVLELFLEKLSDSSVTDVGDLNSFTLNYELGEYASLADIIITDTIDDGLTLIDTGDINFVVNPDGTTTITWDIGALAKKESGSIVYTTSTDQQYSDGSFVASGDILSNNCVVEWTDPNTGERNSESSQVNLTIDTPTIEKEIEGYYDANKNPSTQSNATKGDYVGFRITYDASNLASVQKSVSIFDYAPLSMTITSLPEDLVYSDPAYNSIVPEIVDFNGLVWNFGDLPANTSFSMTFKLPVTDFSSEFDKNLSKISLYNSDNKGYSDRSSVDVALSTPNLQLTHVVESIDTPINSAVLNSVYDYTVVISNTDLTSTGNPTSDMFNSDVTITLPPELSFYGEDGESPLPIVSTSNANVSGGTITSPTTYSLNLDELLADGIVTLNFKGLVSSAPIAKRTYPVDATVTRGTTGPDESTIPFPGDPLSKTANIRAQNINLAKTFLPNTVTLKEGYNTSVEVTIPEGVVAYNLTLENNFVTNNPDNIRNVLLDGAPPPSGFVVADNKLIVPIADFIDSTSGANTFILTFDDVATNFSRPNINQEDRLLQTTGHWGYSESDFNSKSATLSTPLTIIAPDLEVELYQNNLTQSSGYTKDIISADNGHTMQYRYVITNNGPSTAYNIDLISELCDDIDFIEFNTPNGSYDPTNKTISGDYESLLPGQSVELIFTSKVSDDAPDLGDICITSGDIKYYSLETNGFLFEESSNEVRAINNPLSIVKTQTDSTSYPNFTINTLSLVKNESLYYKITLRNPSDYTLTNVTVQDIYPSLLDFERFEPFPQGTLSREDNIVTAQINSIGPNETIEFIYVSKLNSDVLQSNSTNAYATYTINNESVEYNNRSNTVITYLYGNGRGYSIY